MKYEKLKKIGEWLNTQGYGIDLEDDFWMEEYDWFEHKTRDICELLNDYHTEQLSLGTVIYWVACKDLMPKERGAYLINWDGTVIEAEFYPDKQLWGDTEISVYKNVTHWAELPKPPCI
jgi:hypothetical protein